MDYFKLFRRYWLLLIGVPLLTAGLTYAGVQRIQPEYASTATVVVLNRGPEATTEAPPAVLQGEAEAPADRDDPARLSDFVVDERLISTYLALVKRRPVLEEAAERLGFTGMIEELAASVAASNPPGTQLISIRAENPDPEVAAAIANAVAEAFINRTELEMGRPGALALAEQGSTPLAPFSPNLRVSLALAVMLAGVGATSLALVLDRVDKRIRTPEDVKAATQLPTIGIIPSMGAVARGRAWVRPVDSDWADAFRRLRTSLTATGLGTEYHSLLITSQTSGVGKSLMAANLAIAYALSGFRVLLIDLDLHRPTQHHLFGLASERGLAPELTHGREGEPLPAEATQFANLMVVPAGTTTHNVDDLLALGLPEYWLRAAYQRVDIVIVDGPSFSDSPAVRILPRNLDASLIVVAGNRTTQAELSDAVEQLEASSSRVVGVVINRTRRDWPRRQPRNLKNVVHQLLAPPARQAMPPHRTKGDHVPPLPDSVNGTHALSGEHINGSAPRVELTLLPGRTRSGPGATGRARQSRPAKAHESFPSMIGIPLGRHGRET